MAKKKDGKFLGVTVDKFGMIILFFGTPKKKRRKSNDSGNRD